MICTLRLKMLLLCCLALAALPGSAQGWEHKYNPDVYMAINTIYPTQDGAYLVSGMHTNWWTPQRIMKVDGAGGVMWKMDYDSFSYQAVSNITHDGGLVVFGLTLPDAQVRMKDMVMRVDGNGHELWRHIIYPFAYASGATGTANRDIDTTADGGFVCAFTPHDSLYVTRLDSAGSVVWQRSYYNSLSNKATFIIRNSKDGGFLVSCKTDSALTPIGFLFKIDANGNFLWEYRVVTPGVLDAVVAQDGNILLSRVDINDVYTLTKITQNGNFLWEQSYPPLQSPNTDVVDRKLTENADGTFTLIGEVADTFGSYQPFLAGLDSSGNVLRYRAINISNLGINHPGKLFFAPRQGIARSHEGGYMLGGSTLSADYGSIIIKTDSSGIVYPAAMSGYVYDDADSSCTRDSAEAALTPSFITVTSARDTFTVVTDGTGYYSVGLDTVIYHISVAAPSPYWQQEACAPSSILVPFGGDRTVSFGYKSIASGPYVSIDGHIGHHRPCTPGVYTVEYCNYGTTPFYGHIQLDVDTVLHIDSASVPWLSHVGSMFTFPNDTVGVMQCVTMELYYTVACDQGLINHTVCIDAQAIQDTIVNASPLWDQSNLRMAVAYSPLTDSITFTLKNYGAGGMSGPKGMIVIEDNVILMTLPQHLATGAQFIQKIKANGSTFRATIPQTDFNPYSKFATAAIEAVGQNAQGGVSLQYFTQYPYNGYTSFHHNACIELTNAFDPNAKSVSPKGAGLNQLIDTNVTLEYTIDFQNTGNDTAYFVSVTDTLPPYVDPSTIRLGSSSSPCTMSMQGRNTVVFTFLHINLVDSMHNELHSHGYVNFRIDQRPGNIIGTVIENKANIYFDYNQPVTTNTATVRIGQVFVTGIETLYKDKPIQITAYPNPFNTTTMIRVDGENFKDLHLTVYDVTGRVVTRLDAQNANQFILDKSALATGAYTFTISGDGHHIGTGRIIAR